MDLLALALAGCSAFFVVVALAIARRELRALVAVAAAPLERELLVVIPARNEGTRIAPVLDALLREPRADLRVLVVDDRSSDDTAAVVDKRAAADARVRLVRLHDDPPAGVFGKPRALQAAVDDARAHGGLPARLLFLDADVLLAEGALGGMVRAFDAAGADALSGVPRVVCKSVAERLFVPALASVVTGPYSPTLVHEPAQDVAFLNGQVILIRDFALDAVGGWGAVADTVLEDVALAKKLKRANLRLRLADLRDVASTRMYESFAQIDEGFGKNAVALLGKRAAIIGLFGFFMSTLPWTVGAIAFAVPTETSLFAWGLVFFTLLAQVWIRRQGRVDVWPVLVLPVVYAGVAYVLVRATLRRSITWRGRTYARSLKGG